MGKQFQICGYEEIVHITCVICCHTLLKEVCLIIVKLLFSGENALLMLGKRTEQMSSALMYWQLLYVCM
jgi:hypothetical protein